VDVSATAEQLDRDLQSAGRPERARKEAAYLHSQLRHYGAPVPAVRAAIKAVLSANPELGHDDLMELAKQLWDQPVHERRLAAAVLLTQRQRLIGLDDVPQIEHMLRDSRTWALVDVLAGDLLGPVFDQKHDGAAVTEILDRWARDDNFWIRRSALLVHNRPLRAGHGDWERFARYADRMLDEKEFFIRKAIGWVLRETSRRRPELVAEWLIPRAGRASGVTIKEAVKYLSEDQREDVLSQRR
jgi:3-methyladenine DNA glycosylase AlkD